MKRMILFIAIILPFFSYAQEPQAAIRLGGGYAHDFPGLNGASLFGEYTRSLSSNWQVAIGGKWSNLQGFPRTKEVKEFTKAIGLDFEIYFVPLVTTGQQLRVGAGYTFSFYSMRRTYPLAVSNGNVTEIKWPVQDTKGRVSGINLLAEYEYFFPNSNFSLGARASFYKGYDYISFAGAFVGIKI